MARAMRIVAVLIATTTALSPRTDHPRRRATAAIPQNSCDRRGFGALVVAAPVAAARRAAAADQYYDSRPQLDEVAGLVVLRVAQVADFQEKLLREVAKGTDLGVPVTPQQFIFGTELLLRNSNIDGNIKLMIKSEVPRDSKELAIARAPVVMNDLTAITDRAKQVRTPLLSGRDASDIADLYAQFRRDLLLLFATLPPDLQKRYSGYADALLAYEKDLSKNCKGGASGGCLEEEAPEAPAAGGDARPKAGAAPKALEAALAAQAEAAPPPPPEPWSPPPYKPARGSFADMASRY